MNIHKISTSFKAGASHDQGPGHIHRSNCHRIVIFDAPTCVEDKHTSKRTTTANTNKPAHEIRINGIRATIWKNDTEKGSRFNTTFERSYKDGEEWKTSDSYGREDLLLLAYMAKEAFAWIAKQPTK